MYGDVERVGRLLRPVAVDGNTQVFVSGPMYGRSKPDTDVVARHGEQIARGMALRHVKIAIGRSQIIEAFILAVD
jgi:hypothetical protein